MDTGPLCPSEQSLLEDLSLHLPIHLWSDDACVREFANPSAANER